MGKNVPYWRAIGGGPVHLDLPLLLPERDMSMDVFNSRVEYGLLAMAVLAEGYDGQRLLKTADIAEKAGLPPKYLGQILLDLKKKALVSSETGPRGGYSLMRPPEMISVAEVIDAVGSDGIRKIRSCSEKGQYGRAMDRLEERFTDVKKNFFSGVSLLDFVKGAE